jgi:hypothetical protein
MRPQAFSFVSCCGHAFGRSTRRRGAASKDRVVDMTPLAGAALSWAAGACCEGAMIQAGDQPVPGPVSARSSAV